MSPMVSELPVTNHQWLSCHLSPMVVESVSEMVVWKQAQCPRTEVVRSDEIAKVMLMKRMGRKLEWRQQSEKTQTGEKTRDTCLQSMGLG